METAAAVLRQHAARGFPIFDADKEVHLLYDSEEGCNLLAPLVPEATRSGRVDRKILTEIVQRDADLLSRIEPVVHAAIRQRREKFIAQNRSLGVKAVVLDIPLLFETGGEKSSSLALPELISRGLIVVKISSAGCSSI